MSVDDLVRVSYDGVVNLRMGVREMEKIVTITVPVCNPAALEEEGYQAYKARMEMSHPLIKTPDDLRQYHLMAASWELSISDPITNGWRRAAREWLEANPL